jgi:hypothetical protein
MAATEQSAIAVIGIDIGKNSSTSLGSSVGRFGQSHRPRSAKYPRNAREGLVNTANTAFAQIEQAAPTSAEASLEQRNAPDADPLH